MIKAEKRNEKRKRDNAVNYAILFFFNNNNNINNNNVTISEFQMILYVYTGYIHTLVFLSNWKR